MRSIIALALLLVSTSVSTIPAQAQTQKSVRLANGGSLPEAHPTMSSADENAARLRAVARRDQALQKMAQQYKREINGRGRSNQVAVANQPRPNIRHYCHRTAPACY
jgi:hypothetical protein